MTTPRPAGAGSTPTPGLEVLRAKIGALRPPQAMRLAFGEMTAGEARLAGAILDLVQREIDTLRNPGGKTPSAISNSETTDETEAQGMNHG